MSTFHGGMNANSEVLRGNSCAFCSPTRSQIYQKLRALQLARAVTRRNLPILDEGFVVRLEFGNAGFHVLPRRSAAHEETHAQPPLPLVQADCNVLCTLSTSGVLREGITSVRLHLEKILVTPVFSHREMDRSLCLRCFSPRLNTRKI